MSNLEYLTLDLFIYNLTHGLGENESQVSQVHQTFWSNLPEKLKEVSASVTVADENPYFLNFLSKVANYSADGSYSSVNFGDTDCLRFCCSVDGKFAPDELKVLLPEVRDSAILPKVEYLAPENILEVRDSAILPKDEKLTHGILSEEGFLGQTWMVSGWKASDTDTTPENLAHEAYKALIGKKHQYQQKGEFLGGTVFELWCGSQRWEGIEKKSHVLMIFYPDKATFAEAAKYYNAWRYLFYCYHKIIWAYEQARKLKARLLNTVDVMLPNVSNLSHRTLKELKENLQTNIHTLFDYVLDINYLEIQQHTIEVNLLNYQKQCEEYFKNEKFLEDFSNTVTRKYKVQLEKDYATLRPGVSILENLTNTIRGMVEIEQAERDRTFQTIVGVAGVGIGTASVLASTVSPFVEGITQQPFKKADGSLLPNNAAWLNIKTAGSISIGIGLLFSAITYLVILNFKRSRRPH